MKQLLLALVLLTANVYGRDTLYVSDRLDYRLTAYQDSLKLYKFYLKQVELITNMGKCYHLNVDSATKVMALIVQEGIKLGIDMVDDRRILPIGDRNDLKICTRKLTKNNTVTIFYWTPGVYMKPVRPVALKRGFERIPLMNPLRLDRLQGTYTAELLLPRAKEVNHLTLTLPNGKISYEDFKRLYGEAVCNRYFKKIAGP